ncbi:putative Ku-like DNA-end-binding protein [Thiobacillus denitrificans ATCC 25259]|uniref:Non-homologous end joining protein Ku n=1 Tax=Thiobacillus denitrificans (strain ATCC 25259 / T1) TaxID=292415 RepID=Q3SGP8_THIDA|nr:Ku protein [Thiobacillus denitrificans]AAZ98199.1 putative Ku-like DNA-end-binding protein [Thiobacillus denitrificans ATCC 25259]
MATSPRTLWKGAISFGLVHIPIALYTATTEQGLDFDWLDKRSMDPVGYKRVNKRTGKEISRENIVKGIEYEDGRYVVLSPEEIAAAYPKTTQTIEIETFAPAADIPFIYLDRPYYVAPINKGAKVYALLREILRKTGKVGIARVVIQSKQHLAALMPYGPVMVLNLLRWGDKIRGYDALDLPAEGIKAAGVSDKEMRIGEQLVEDMSAPWDPAATRDSFKEQILQLVEAKAQAGKLESVAPIEAREHEPAGATIYDLTELLQRSLSKAKQDKQPSARATPKARAGAKTPTKSGGKRKAA